MPELPEVETIARGLDKRVRGDAIESVRLGSKPEPLKSSAEEIVGALESKTIAGVRRVGKHIVFDLASSSGSPAKNTHWIVHLGMTGSLRVTAADVAIEKHTHAILKLSSGRELRFID